jgi:DNA-directed RNA polymerase specialized sigma24 family protein
VHLHPGDGTDDSSTTQLVSIASTELAALESVETAFNPTSRRAADRLARLAVDRDLHDRLAAANFTGPEYQRLANELAAYGIVVVAAWMLSGEMFRLCAARHRAVGLRPQTWTEHDVAGLADDTVTAALIEFRRRAVAGAGWEYSESAASLKTYFITGCILAFPNAYRQWERAEQRWHRLHDLRETFDDITTEAVGIPDVGTTVAHRLDATAGYAGLSARERLIVLYELAGYSNVEIAELLDMASSRAAEGVLYRLQVKAKKQWDRGGANEHRQL